MCGWNLMETLSATHHQTEGLLKQVRCIAFYEGECSGGNVRGVALPTRIHVTLHERAENQPNLKH